MQVLAYNYIDSFSNIYKETLTTAIDSARNLDADIIITQVKKGLKQA
jgi:hypothetical protein